MKIIDSRLRPPFGSIKEQKFFANKEFARNFNAKFGMPYPESAEKDSMEILLQEMEQNNIVKGLTPFRRMQNRGMRNDDFEKLNNEYPGKFVGFAGMNPMIGVKETLDEIDKYVVNGPFTGVNFEPGLDPINWRLDNKQFYPIYEKCEAENIPVYITWGGLVAPPYIYEPQIIDTVARNFPKMKMMLAHAGFPRSAEHCTLCMNHPNIFLGIDLYIVNAPAAQDFIVSANYRCKDQICFGSAYPYNDLSAAVEWYKNAGFREDVLENIFYKNAARFAGIE